MNEHSILLPRNKYMWNLRMKWTTRQMALDSQSRARSQQFVYLFIRTFTSPHHHHQFSSIFFLSALELFLSCMGRDWDENESKKNVEKLSPTHAKKDAKSHSNRNTTAMMNRHTHLKGKVFYTFSILILNLIINKLFNPFLKPLLRNKSYIILKIANPFWQEASAWHKKQI